MIRPAPLPEGGTIGVVSPSHPLSAAGEEALGRGVVVLEGLGYRVRLGDHVHARRWYTAGSRAERLADLHAMVADPGVHAVLMSQGGKGAVHLLDGLDHRLLAARPTAFVGMSDGTALVGAMATRGVVAFHGANVAWGWGVVGGPAPHVVDQFRHVLAGGHGPMPTRGLQVLREGRATGPLCGGHLDTLVVALTSGHVQVPEGAVLLLEATGTVDRFDSTLTALRLGGHLDGVVGVVLGQVEGHETPEPERRRAPADVVLEVLGDRQIPVVEVAELGHGVDNLTFPLGLPVVLDTADGVLSLAEPAVA